MDAAAVTCELMLGRRAARFRFGIARSDDEPCAVAAVASDEYGCVLLASPDGERFRIVERLAMSAAEAKGLFEQSSAPTITSADVRHRFGQEIAKLRLDRA